MMMESATTTPIDPQYMDRVVKRMAALERVEISTRQDAAQAHRELERLREDLRIELAVLRAELAGLDGASKILVERAKQTVGQFRTVVKKGDMTRLQSRVDGWAPESKISQEGFRNILYDENDDGTQDTT